MESENAGHDSSISMALLKKTSVNQNMLIMLPVLMILLAELLIFAGEMQYAVWLHVLLLIGLALAPVYIHTKNIYITYQALMLLPLLRLVNLSMPVFFEMTLFSYIFVYAPLIVPIYIVAVHQNFTSAQIGLTMKNFRIFTPVGIILALVIAQGEYYIIQPGYLIPDLSFKSIVELSIVMFLFIGLVEELIFRSIIQTRLEQSMGMFSGLVVTGVMFGIMHSGYGTIYEILFTSLAGLSFGYLFQKTRSLPLIATIHGLVNIFLFGILPHLGPGLGLL
jgi:membrane protease YdiL (CAAX protease family)